MKAFTIAFNEGVPVLGEFVSDSIHWLTAGADNFLNYVEFPCIFDFGTFYTVIKDREEYDKVIGDFTDEQFMNNLEV